jgi:hypothetical protein
MARRNKSEEALALTGEQMTVEMLTGVSGDGFATPPSGPFECDKAIAEMLIARGYAKAIAASE